MAPRHSSYPRAIADAFPQFFPLASVLQPLAWALAWPQKQCYSAHSLAEGCIVSLSFVDPPLFIAAQLSRPLRAAPHSRPLRAWCSTTANLPI